jgi:serine protease AprX
MEIVFGRSWQRVDAGRMLGAFIALALALSLMSAPGGATATGEAAGSLVRVIVRSLPGWQQTAEGDVKSLGGHVGRRIGIIHGFVGGVPRESLATLKRSPGVDSVTLDKKVHLSSVVDGYDASGDLGSMYNTNKIIKANTYWKSGFTGQGVDVALIDSGVAPVDGLSSPGKVVNGADLSFDSQADNLRYLDGYGHGTFMAGIIAGRDDPAGFTYGSNPDSFDGVAPDARIVNVKVADENGASDISQVIAGIDWVVTHRNDNGMNIRVLNLSFGTDGTQDYKIDPLAYAAEVAWRKGIVVVVAGGNSGYGSNKLNDPAYDPYVIAVGADDPKGTSATNNDVIPSFSSTGDGTRNPDLVAPGKSIQSLRVPNSYIDLTYPTGKINTRFFRGSGTSEATAMISGAAALLLSQRPGITPDQVKAILTQSATKLPSADPIAQGWGLVNLAGTLGWQTPSSTQTWPVSTGTGSLELARGSEHVADDTVVLQGEQDIFGNAWDGTTWAPAMWNETSWAGGVWRGYAWSGDAWLADSWAGKSWSSILWTGTAWSGKSWSSILWSGKSWTGKSWSSGPWSGKSWTGTNWSGQEWSSSLWGTQTGYKTASRK